MTTIPNAEDAHTYGTTNSGTSFTPFAKFNPEVFEHIARRFIVQTLIECLPDHWLRRAQQFEAVGTIDAMMTAAACRRHAWLLATSGPGAEFVAETSDVLAEVA